MRGKKHLVNKAILTKERAKENSQDEDEDGHNVLFVIIKIL